MQTGRQGSSAAKWPIQAPPTPRLRSRSGPTQQADAPIPASTPPARAIFAFSDDRLPSQPFSFHSKLRTLVRSQRGCLSDNLTIGILAKRGGVNVETIRY